MLGLLRKALPPPYSIVEERYHTRFRRRRGCRLEEECAPRYTTSRTKGCYRLEISSRDVFCWSLAPRYRYDDFSLAADVTFDATNGHSAAGFVLRFTDESNFYYFLISNQGYFRYDLVFGGNYIPLIDWTAHPLIGVETSRLRILCRGGRHLFCLGEEWAGEIEDDHLRAGMYGFAGQNFSESPRAGFSLLSLTVESRPVDVEHEHLRWTQSLAPEPESRMRLARTFQSMGSPVPAAVQMNRALIEGPGTADEHCTLAALYNQIRMFDHACRAASRCIELQGDHRGGHVEKAHALYGMNSLVECRDFSKVAVVRWPDEAELHLVLGNAEHALGNAEGALVECQAAWRIEPDNAIARVNGARAAEMLGRTQEAVAWLLDAAEILYRAGDFVELGAVLPRAERLDPTNERLASLRARALYQEGEEEEARRILEDLVEAGTSDSGAHFLMGLLLGRDGRREEALERFARAVELDPIEALYWFRLAETRFLMGLNCADALQEALRLGPDDAWAHNLRGLVASQENRPEDALEAFGRAQSLAPAEPSLLINYSDALLESGRSDEALEILKGRIEREPGAHELYNHQGNLLSRAGRSSEALASYEAALDLEPSSDVYLENCARVCIELDMILKAEECLRKLEEQHPTERVYALIGRLASLEEEFERAEAAFRQAIVLATPSGDDLSHVMDLCAFYIDRNNYRAAREQLREALARGGDPESGPSLASLVDRFHSRFEQRLECSGCGREWWIPQEMEPQLPLRVRGEPPDEAPAGRCPSCGGLYCVGCAKSHVRGTRLVCPGCGEGLRLREDGLIYQFRRSVSGEPWS